MNGIGRKIWQFIKWLLVKMDEYSSKIFHFFSTLLTIGIAIIVLLLFFGKVTDMWDKRDSDDDPNRGALIGISDKFGDKFDTVYPDNNKWPGSQDWQNWSPEDSMWFYTTTQGSDLIPYDFFMVLEQADSEKLFRDNEHINYYRYIPLKKTSSNPDGLPLGFVKDTYLGDEYVGFTCAACHTTQINYKGVGMRIDGGPAMSDMYNFMIALRDALGATWNDKAKQARFVQAVLDRGDFSSEKKVLKDLEAFNSSINRYVVINESTPYGYARLDAFGRIYNRVLEHILNKDTVKNALKTFLTEDKLKEVMRNLENKVVSSSDFDHILEKLESLLSRKQILALRDELFNKPDAPVSYPFLWDISRHDYVQWNGIAANAGVGPIGRNSGEVIGVFGTLDWAEVRGKSLASYIGGQVGEKSHVDYKSSIDMRNLKHIENRLATLQSPQWPKEVLGKFDQNKEELGRALFKINCISCHKDIDRSAEDRRIVAQFLEVSKAGTDKTMAKNALGHTGKSGILKNQYQSFPAGSVLIQDEAPVAVLLTAATTSVVATPDPDDSYITRAANWVYDLASALFDNEIKGSMKAGDYVPDTTQAPFNSLNAYKARPLNGIWATAPYLHNGSIPTLYDLLLPKKKESDPADGQYRPNEFQVGSREFDPVKVGFITEGYSNNNPGKKDNTRFLTSSPGNDNSGHEYKLWASSKDKESEELLTKKQREEQGKVLGKLRETLETLPGKLRETLEKMTEDEKRYALVEYMKTL
ncbi:MAG: ribonuclease E [Candidatus Electrothrix sp. GM3_4]|nr:ribonuclease E [Candidatus Electrothrix sp. GM3_4]